MAMSAVSVPNRAKLADPSLRRAVEAAVRRRVRGDEAEDVVQATFTDVLAAARLPEDDEELRRFVFGVARNKVCDHFRRQRRQQQELIESETEGRAAEAEALSARDMLRWAEAELADPEARVALQWMLREGDGEKLEHIARDARVPAPRVRKRVSRLRKLLRQRWAAELLLAAMGVLLLLAAGALYLLKYGKTDDVVRREPPRELPSARPAPSPRALPSATPTAPQSRPALAPNGERRAVTGPEKAPSAPTPSASPSATPPAKPAPQLKPPPRAPRPASTSPASKSDVQLNDIDFSPSDKK